MDNKKFELYLNKIGEWVIDENKILTYKSLSKNLGVHINTAKQLLHSYWIRQKNDETLSISATFIVAGRFRDGTLSCTIVNENALKITCSEFLEITSKHIYSIQAAEKIKEIKVLGENNKVERTTESIIKCSKSILKSKKDSRQESKLFAEDEKSFSSECKNVEAKQTKISGSDVELEESPTEKINDTVSISPKENVTSQNKKNVEKKCGSEKTKEKNTKHKGNIVNFFANSTSKNKPSNATIEIVDVSKDKDKKNEVPLIEIKEREKNKNKSKFKSNRPKKNIKTEYSDRQKRKRIQVFSDSENSESCSEEDVTVEDDANADQLLIPSTFTEEENKVELNCKNKRKKRKIVDVTVMSEDGYLETKKEIVYATDSEEESEICSKSLETNISDSKKFKMENKEKEFNSCRAPKKQSSLLNFFKKN